jgi:hypothetical protein
MTNTDTSKIGDLVRGILSAIYVEKRPFFENLAAGQGIDVEQFAAAAIAEALCERMESAAQQDRPRRQRR